MTKFTAFTVGLSCVYVLGASAPAHAQGNHFHNNNHFHHHPAPPPPPPPPPILPPTSGILHPYNCGPDVDGGGNGPDVVDSKIVSGVLDTVTNQNQMQVQTFVNEGGDRNPKGDEAGGSIWSGLNYKFGSPGLNQGSFAFDYNIQTCQDLWVGFIGTRADGTPFTSGNNAGPLFIQASQQTNQPIWPTPSPCTPGIYQHVEFNPTNTPALQDATVTSIGTITFDFDGTNQNPVNGETEFVTGWTLGPTGTAPFTTNVFPVIDPALTACPGNKNNGWLYANQP